MKIIINVINAIIDFIIYYQKKNVGIHFFLYIKYHNFMARKRVTFDLPHEQIEMKGEPPNRTKSTLFQINIIL